MKVKIFLFSLIILSLVLVSSKCYWCDSSGDFQNCSSVPRDCHIDPSIYGTYITEYCDCNDDGSKTIPPSCFQDEMYYFDASHSRVSTRGYGRQNLSNKCPVCVGEEGESLPPEEIINSKLYGQDPTINYPFLILHGDIGSHNGPINANYNVTLSADPCDCPQSDSLDLLAGFENISEAFRQNKACYVCNGDGCYQCVPITAHFGSRSSAFWRSYVYKSDIQVSGQENKELNPKAIFFTATGYFPACNPSTQCQNPSCTGDTNLDNRVDTVDLANILDTWLRTGCSSSNRCCGGADINGDGAVDFYDYNLITKNWGLDCSGGPPVIKGDL